MYTSSYYSEESIGNASNGNIEKVVTKKVPMYM